MINARSYNTSCIPHIFFAETKISNDSTKLVPVGCPKKKIKSKCRTCHLDLEPFLCGIFVWLIKEMPVIVANRITIPKIFSFRLIISVIIAFVFALALWMVQKHIHNRIIVLSQCCGSGFIESRSWSSKWIRIRIRFWIQIQGFDDQKLQFAYPWASIPIGPPSCSWSLQPSKENI